MKTRKSKASSCFVAAIAGVFVFGDYSVAHEGGHDPSGAVAQTKSTWTIEKTRRHFHGSFLSADETIAKFETSSGKVLEVPRRDLIQADGKWITDRLESIRNINQNNPVRFVKIEMEPELSSTAEFLGIEDAPAIFEHFKPFEKTLGLRWDSDYFYVESNGIPDHPMMVGITAWQQQVPLPQAYTGRNAWRIPLHPKPAQKPMSAKNNFFRGAIALAVNGIPIFNPIKNDGKTDTLLAGELDQWGGHCGRADDYHYHIAPIHLEPIVGKGKPIGYALDGYPIYGYQDAQDNQPLDWMNGHKDKQGNYHYHATEKYPYINGGFYGQVLERDGQVDPQPRAESPRPALPPMRGAKIVGFEEISPKNYQLTYEVSGRKGYVRYTLQENGAVAFEFQDPSGKLTKDTDTARSDRAKINSGTIKVVSSSVDARGMLIKDCTCDGSGQSPAVAWDRIPEGTKSIAVSLWHEAPDQEKSYWLVYNVPVTATGIGQNKKPEGTLGLNDKKRHEYDPMCSKGPGVKTYHITVYALSKNLELPAKEVDRKRLLEAIKDCKLAEGTLDYQYERSK
ncbi:MAG: YHYH protein [Planctomycetota bacterium]